MKQISEKPYLIFLILSPILFLVGYFSKKDTFDINIHDTYYVVEHGLVPIVISFFFVIIGISYLIMLKLKVKLYKWLTLTHILVTLFGLLIIRILFQLYRDPKNESILQDYDYNENLNIVILIIALTIIFVQFLFPINIIISLIRRKKN